MTDIEYQKVVDLHQYELDKSQGIVTRIYSTDDITDDIWIFLTDDEQRLLDQLKQDTLELHEVAIPFNGIQTSRDNVYVIKEWEDVGDYIEFTDVCDQTWRIERSILKPYLSDHTKFKSFQTKNANARLIFPYEMVDRKMNLMSETKLIEEYPNTYEYLKAFRFHSENLCPDDSRHKCLERRDMGNDVWYAFGRVQSLSVFENQSKIIVGVLFQKEPYIYDETSIYFTSGGTAGYCGIKNKDKSKYSLYYIMGLLNSKAIEWVAKQMASMFQGDYVARGTSLLKKLPIKTIDFEKDGEKEKHDEIVEMVQKLIRLHSDLESALTPRDEEDINTNIQSNRDELETKINELYGIVDLIQYAD